MTHAWGVWLAQGQRAVLQVVRGGSHAEPFTPEDAYMLQLLGRHVEGAIRNVAKREALQAEREAQAKLTAACFAMTRGEDEVIEHARKLLDADDCVLFMVENPDTYSASLRPLGRSSAAVPSESYKGLLARCNREKHVLNLSQAHPHAPRPWLRLTLARRRLRRARRR